MTTLPKIAHQYLKSWFIAISSTQTRELVPQEKPKSCYNGNPYITPPYLSAIITAGFGFQFTHIYAEVFYFDIISGSCGMKRPKSDK